MSLHQDDGKRTNYHGRHANRGAGQPCLILLSFALAAFPFQLAWYAISPRRRAQVRAVR